MKKYKVYNGNIKHNVVGYTVPVQIERQNKHRDEIVDYLDNMDDPTISVEQVSGEDVATLSFTPFTQQMAEWFVNSKTVFFGVVRNRVNDKARSHYYKVGINGRRHKRTRNKVSANFNSYYDFDNRRNESRAKVSIPNTEQDQLNRVITVQELTRGYITRNVEHLKNLNFGKHSFTEHAYDKARDGYVDEEYVNRFYVGFIYFDKFNIPTAFKMCEYECEMIYNTNE